MRIISQDCHEGYVNTCPDSVPGSYRTQELLVSFMKDLLCVNAWVGPCLEEGQRGGPALRELTTLLADRNNLP